MPTATNNRPRVSGKFVTALASEHLVLVLCVIYFAALAPFTEGFASAANFHNILLTLMPLLLLAIGQTLVLITAGIDLSITSTVALASVVGATIIGDNGPLAHRTAGVPLAILAMIGIGAAVGLLNGIAVAMLRMPAFIVTLTMMTFMGGFAVWLTQSRNIGGLPEAFTAVGNRLWISLSLTAALALFAHFLLSRSLFGRWLYATGQNVNAAHISGVPVKAVTVFAYVASGVCAALASVLLTGQAETGSPVLGRNMLLDVIGAAVIGGTSLFGGKGRIAWTLFGVLFLKLIDNSLNLLSLSDWDIRIVKGAVILFAAVMDAMRNRFLARGS